MIRLGLRLTLNGGKEAAVRFAITTAAVAIGVALLLTALAGMNAINAQNSRSAWLNTGLREFGPPPPTVAGPSPAGDPLWWEYSIDHFGSRTIDRVDVAATGSHSPVPPGITRLPGPGEYYASPALSRLLASTPANELRDRFPGRQIGTLGAEALPAPNSLIALVGQTSSAMSAAGAQQVTTINTDSTLDGPAGIHQDRLTIILAVGALALLFPVLVFIATATRLAAARREQRFAAMRLVGATPRQVSVVAAVEASVAAFAGVVVGFVAFAALRVPLTNVGFTGEPFAHGDLSLSVTDIAIAALGVPAAAAIAARVAMRRVNASPLGVSSRATPAAPRAWRLILLVAGLGELAYFVGVGHPKTTGAQIEAYFAGCLLTMVGLVVAGPWLTMVGARLLARRASRPSTLIAGRRMSDDPRGAFRAISGLILALFVTSLSVGVISTILHYKLPSKVGAGGSSTLLDRFDDGPDAGTPTVDPAVLARLRATANVAGVAVLRAPVQEDQRQFTPTLLVACSELLHTPSLGRCAPGATVATVTGTLDGGSPKDNTKLANTVWPAASVSLQRLDTLAVRGVAVYVTGPTAALERARTAMSLALPAEGSPQTLNEIDAGNFRQIKELQQLTNVVIVVSLVVAGCSLAVTVTAGISDRKRPFSLLRLTGVPLDVLRGVVAMEAAVPLLLIALLSAATGFLAAGLFLRSQLGEVLRPPGAGYYALVATGLVASLAIIASTLPLIDRITGAEVARND